MVDERSVSEGYKVTEVGIIPDDWEVIEFNDCFELLPNNTFSRSELNYNFGDFKNIHYGDILIKFSSILDCSAMEIPFINTNHMLKNNRALVKDGDIIFADTAEDETVGKAIEIFNVGSQKVVSGLHTIPCRPKVIFEPKWLGYYLNHSTYHDQLLPYITGTKVSAISKSSIKETKVVKPLPVEQKAIAEALSDTDSLIQSVEKLIDKKKKIKQGAMQQLLTGKKRLPGFSGKWEVKKLGEVAVLKHGYSFSSKTYEIDGKYKVVTIANVQKGFMSTTSCSTIKDLPADIQAHQQLSIDDLLISLTGNVGRVCMVNQSNCVLNQRVGKFVISEKYDFKYVYYSLNLDSFIEEMMLSAKGGAQPNLGNSDVLSYDLCIPNDIEEQKAIAQVLSDMDAEIEALEEKLEKVKTIKQGMMQELLTGRIRLI